MGETRLDAVRKELLSGALKEYANLEWFTMRRDALGDNWDFYATVGRKLEEEGLVEYDGVFDRFSVRLTPDGQRYCTEEGIY
jgi:hypothetical protein